MSRLMRGRGIMAASFSKNSDGSKQIARVPSRHGRRRRSRTLPCHAIEAHFRAENSAMHPTTFTELSGKHSAKFLFSPSRSSSLFVNTWQAFR